MNSQPSDTALLESALAAIERVLARADSALHGDPYVGPTHSVPLEFAGSAPTTEEQRFRASAAQSAINICLCSAAALIDASEALMNRRTDRSPQELEREWKTLVNHTKTASRSAYRAALIMASHRHVLAAQGAAPAEHARRVAH
ncbi:hypothetical protein SRS16CHR_02222 [Variovorax sp. SRS16]|uniref:hypothetical protein n=1 Tax=Variovorax sp. SRS16 TaxID=282217 RepID=UPI001318D769|nr:hypothetical protein [Variovorax sp. SRS16]VTU18385.1 hypothetical protein SRS16CHR_02222 [Variovorax sp. SRS16]